MTKNILSVFNAVTVTFIYFCSCTCNLVLFPQSITLQKHKRNQKYIQTIYQQLRQLESKNPKYIKTKKCQSDQRIEYVTFGDFERKIKAMIVCGTHARQLITSDTCMHVINYIADHQDEYSDVFITIIPVLNTNRKTVLEGNTCVRVNERGVDPNRNFPVNFQNGQKRNGTQTYQGPFPLSQNSSKCVDSLLSEAQYDFFIDIHTGQFSIFHTYEQQNSSRKAFNTKVTRFIKRNYCPNCLVTSLFQLHKRPAAGQMFEFASKNKKVKHSFLFEMFGGKLPYSVVGSYKGCFKQFNPNTVQIRDHYINRSSKIIRKMLQFVIEQNNEINK